MDFGWTYWAPAFVCFTFFFHIFTFGHMCYTNLSTPSVSQTTLNSLYRITSFK